MPNLIIMHLSFLSTKKSIFNKEIYFLCRLVQKKYLTGFYSLIVNLLFEFLHEEIRKRAQDWKQTTCDALQDMVPSLTVLILVSQ